jgi:uroporphyrinogen decarboxylase
MDSIISSKLGFDANYYRCFSPAFGLRPCFESKVIEELPDGTRKILNQDGVVVLSSPEAGSIPAEVEHLLVDRASWEEHYVHRVQFSEDRILKSRVNVGDHLVPFTEGGLDFLKNDPASREEMTGLHCGSLFGTLRNWIGVVGSAYIYCDDEELFTEMIDTVANLSYTIVETVLNMGARFDFAHFWEDICFKNGPLIAPDVFDDKVGPHYRRITKLLNSHGIKIVSLDCDGCIDALIPTWLTNGVNTMFPIEVGTWNASIAPWREKYGRELRGVGGMNKVVFSRDRAAIDAEIERLKPLVDLGGFIPCPDHRIAPDAKWDNVQYYCERLREIYS